MPNKKEHFNQGLIIGFITGGGTTFLKEYQKSSNIPNYEINWSRISLNSFYGSLLGAGCGILPDLIEPATDPNHRSFFHSKAFAMLIFLKLISIKNKQTLDEKSKPLIYAAGVGYLSHLLFDSQTSKGLPQI